MKFIKSARDRVDLPRAGQLRQLVDASRQREPRRGVHPRVAPVGGEVDRLGDAGRAIGAGEAPLKSAIVALVGSGHIGSGQRDRGDAALGKRLLIHVTIAN